MVNNHYTVYVLVSDPKVAKNLHTTPSAGLKPLLAINKPNFLGKNRMRNLLAVNGFKGVLCGVSGAGVRM